MMSMPLRRLLFVLSAVALTAAACGNPGPGDASGAASLSAPARNAAEAPLLPTDVYALPAFDLATYRELLGQLEGTPVVVNIWASWCGPCRLEAPDLARAANAYGDRVQFLGVDIIDSRESARAFMQEFGWPYPSVFDGAGAIRDGLGFIGQPDTLFYDASGKLVSTWQGPITPGRLTRSIEQLLAQGPPA